MISLLGLNRKFSSVIFCMVLIDKAILESYNKSCRQGIVMHQNIVFKNKRTKLVFKRLRLHSAKNVWGKPPDPMKRGTVEWGKEGG